MQLHDSHHQTGHAGRESALIGCTLRHLTRVVSRYPRLTLCLVLISAFASIGYTVMSLEFRTERSDLINPDAPFHQRWLEYTKNFGDESDIVVVVESNNPHTIRHVLDDLGPRLQREPQTFRDVLYRIDTSGLERKGLQYFTPDQLAAGLRQLDQMQPVLQGGRWDLTRIDIQFAYLTGQFEEGLRRPQTLTRDDYGPLLEHVALLAGSLEAGLDGKGGFKNPWPQAIPGDVPLASSRTAYMLNDRGTMGFIKAKPVTRVDAGFDRASTAIDRLKTLIAEVAPTHPDARISLTGIPVLENDEMRRSQSDMTMASAISLVAVTVLLLVGFRGLRHPLLALVMLLVSMAWTFGYTTLVVGHLNILSVSFAVILIGLGIDFGIHYLARYLEIRHQGRDLRPALKETSNCIGSGILTAAVTTALAFFCATLTDFLGVAELGIIAGGGILICATATFVVLPALIALSDKNLELRQLPIQFDGHLVRNFTARYPKMVTIASAVVLLGIGSQIFQFGEGGLSWRVRFDSNLLNLQAEGVESVEVQQRMFGEADHSLLFAVSVADSPEEARQLRRQFLALPSVARVEDLASRLPAYPISQTKPAIDAIRQRLSGLPNQAPNLPQLNPKSVGRTMEDTLAVVRRVRHPAAESAANAIDGFLNRFESLSLAEQSQFLSSYQKQATAALLAQLHMMARATATEPLTWADLPAELRSRFISSQGQWLLQVFPKNQVWDAQPLAQFVKEVRSVDPEVTGTPLQNYEASRQIRSSYENAAMYAFAMIILMLLVDFLSREQKWLVLGPPLAVVVFAAMMLQTRQVDVSPVLLVGAYLIMAIGGAAILDLQNLRDVMLAMLPPLAGMLLLFGTLGLFGIDLNPANLIILPLVLGIGVDNGVHLIHDFRAQTENYRLTASTANAIVLTALTTIVGFGSMLVSAHRGLTSLGLVMSLGVGCCLFASLIVLPAILAWISSSGQPAASARGNSTTPDVVAHPGQQSHKHHQQQKRRAA